MISTSSKIIQFISRTPAATRTFADIETSGPICRQIERRKHKKEKVQKREDDMINTKNILRMVMI